jgi:DNA topoisomerase-1
MVRLRTVSRAALTVARKKNGRYFAYYDAAGMRVTDAAFRLRAAGLGIPPAWGEVRLAPDPLAHIQACGFDAAGRLQYIYHPDWEARRARRKQRQLGLLATALPRIRRRVAQDLEAEAGSKTLALAIGVALIDRTAMRVGRERYLSANGTRGAGTLYSRDVAVKGGEVRMSFPAKSGKVASYSLADAKLASAIERVKTIPGKRLLMYRGEDGAAHAIRSEELNRYLKEIADAPVTAKDFRTLHASALAGEALAKLEPGGSQSARRRQVAVVTQSVAAFLRNTPAITRKSYIAPCLVALFDSGKLGALWAKVDERHDGLKQRETRLGAVLAAVGGVRPEAIP